MPALNRIQLIGNLGKDPESHLTPSGKQVTNFTIAVSTRLNRGGETKEYTDWLNIEAWSRLGEICQQYLHKGSLIYLEGRLRIDRYEDKGGETKYFTKVVASMMQMLDRKKEDEPAMEVEEAQAEYLA